MQIVNKVKGKTMKILTSKEFKEEIKFKKKIWPKES